MTARRPLTPTPREAGKICLRNGQEQEGLRWDATRTTDPRTTRWRSITSGTATRRPPRSTGGASAEGAG
jgi:hypothetical protein